MTEHPLFLFRRNPMYRDLLAIEHGFRGGVGGSGRLTLTVSSRLYIYIHTNGHPHTPVQTDLRLTSAQAALAVHWLQRAGGGGKGDGAR